MARAAAPNSGLKKPRAKSGSARKRLTPAKEKRGLAAASHEAPELVALAGQLRAAGGAAIGAYLDPLGSHPLLLAVLPLDAIEPTPFQRELSPAHVKRLAQKIDEAHAFLDPLIVVRSASGGFWTPNAWNRLAVAKLLGMRAITALISDDEALAFKILALNTEKAHSTRDRSLEVILMTQALAEARPRTRGRVRKRVRAGTYLSLLRKVDRYSPKSLAASLREREGWASRLLEIDRIATRAVAKLAARGFRSPYLRAFVVARINPVRFVKLNKAETGPAMAIGAALTRMAASARTFDPDAVRERDLQLAAAAAGSAPEAE